MEIAVFKLPKFEIKLTITLTDDELKNFREKAAASISRRVTVPGFREGKAPAFVVESQVGKPAFFQEVLRFALPETFGEAVKQEKLALIAAPRITVLSEYPLKFEALSCLMPEIKIKDYKGVKPKKLPSDISLQEIDDVIREMLKTHAKFEIKEGGVELGDKVEIDFQGYEESGAAIENTKSKQHPLYVGENTLVKGFEEHLIGMKVGEKKRFTLAFPENFHHKPFQSKKVDFEVDMKRVEKVTLPEIDEVFVEKLMGQKASVEAFRGQVAKDLEMQKRKDIRRTHEAEFIEAWMKLCTVEIPPVLIEEEIDYLLDEIRSEIEARGQKWEQFLEYMKAQKKDIRGERRVEAEKRVKVRLMMNEIMRLEGVEASKEELGQVIEGLVRSQPKNEQEKVRNYLRTDRGKLGQIINSIKLKKLFDRFLVSSQAS